MMGIQFKSPSPLWGGIKGGGHERSEFVKGMIPVTAFITPTGSRFAMASACQPPYKGEAVSAFGEGTV